ncbi:hypothetical protein ACLOJK_026679 [Asimina triloba]
MEYVEGSILEYHPVKDDNLYRRSAANRINDCGRQLGKTSNSSVVIRSVTSAFPKIEQQRSLLSLSAVVPPQTTLPGATAFASVGISRARVRSVTATSVLSDVEKEKKIIFTS